MEITSAWPIRKRSFERRWPMTTTEAVLQDMLIPLDERVLTSLNAYPYFLTRWSFSFMFRYRMARKTINKPFHWTFLPRVHSSTQRSRCERAVTSEVARPNRHRNWPVETQARAIISAYQPRPLTSRPINRLLLLSFKSSDAPLTKNICSSYPACSLSPLKLILLLLLLLLSRTSSARIR